MTSQRGIARCEVIKKIRIKEFFHLNVPYMHSELRDINIARFFNNGNTLNIYELYQSQDSTVGLALRNSSKISYFCTL